MRELSQVDFALDEMPGNELHEVLRAFRETAPVMPTRFLGLPAFVITGYDALADAFADTERFPPHLMYENALEPAIGGSFISMQDPERHRVYRKLATPAFRSRAVENYERSGLSALANELVDEIANRNGPVNLVEAYSSRYPYLVISRLLGLPREREASFHEWALALLRFRSQPDKARRVYQELTEFLTPVVDARRRDPRDDVISELVQATVEGRALDDEEIYAHIRLLLPTGGETTHGSLGNLLYSCFTQEGVWKSVCADPARAGDAVEETLRWETPIAVLPRMSCNRDIEFYGVKIPADAWVLFAMAGANRDPAYFPDPDRFDLDRDPRGTLTFGRGIKACPGMHLARKNLSVALEVLAARKPDLRLVDLEKALPRRTVLRTPDALWVEG